MWRSFRNPKQMTFQQSLEFSLLVHEWMNELEESESTNLRQGISIL